MRASVLPDLLRARAGGSGTRAQRHEAARGCDGQTRVYHALAVARDRGSRTGQFGAWETHAAALPSRGMSSQIVVAVTTRGDHFARQVSPSDAGDMSDTTTRVIDELCAHVQEHVSWRPQDAPAVTSRLPDA